MVCSYRWTLSSPKLSFHYRIRKAGENVTSHVLSMLLQSYFVCPLLPVAQIIRVDCTKISFMIIV